MIAACIPAELKAIARGNIAGGTSTGVSACCAGVDTDAAGMTILRLPSKCPPSCKATAKPNASGSTSPPVMK